MRSLTIIATVGFLGAANLFTTGAVVHAVSAYEPELVFELQSDISYSATNNAINAMAAFGKSLAFTTEDGTMYVTDGTTTGTHELAGALDLANVTDVRIGSSANDTDSVGIDGNLVFWGFSDDSLTWELFATDGETVEQRTTDADGFGTLRYLDGELYTMNTNLNALQHIDLATGTVTTIQSGYECFPFDQNDSIVALNGKIVFQFDRGTCDNSLAVWDPETPSVAPVLLEPQINGLGNDGTDTDYLDDRHYYFAHNGYLYFTAAANVANTSVGIELMRTDGTTTELVKDINLGDGWSMAVSRELMFTAVNGEIFFSASDGVNRRMWATDGTEIGTMESPIDETLLFPGAATQAPGTVLDGRILTSFYTQGLGDELYATDGTAGGTELLIDANPGDGDGLCFDDCAPPVLLDSMAFFLAYDGAVNSIFVTDGTAEGTTRLTNANDFSAPYAISDLVDESPLVVAGKNLYFAVTDWVDDGGSGQSALYKFSASDQVSTGLANTGTQTERAAIAGFILVTGGASVLTFRRRLATSCRASKFRPIA